ncbi:MAG: AMMECR1 domain-containing protein [Nitrospirae bacterium]|nr:MAG: AMMECR1 domain-containing protein [Nitrospirota bacterium]
MEIDDGAYLVRLARAALTLWVEEGLATRPPEPPEGLTLRRALWVGLYAYPDRAHWGSMGVLNDPPTVVEATVNAALLLGRQPQQGPPLTPEALAGHTLELSITSEPAPVAAEAVEAAVVPGRHGVVIEDAHRRLVLPPPALLSPSAPLPGFLDEVCERCGLPASFWRRPEAEVATFTVECFAEAWPVGPVVRRAPGEAVVRE